VNFIVSAAFALLSFREVLHETSGSVEKSLIQNLPTPDKQAAGGIHTSFLLALP
jgi:hypothetical protein